MNNPWWYSLYNSSIWILCFIIAYRNYKLYPYRGNVVGRNNKQVILCLFVLFVMTTMFTLRGGDAERYKEFVEEGSYNYGLRDFYAFEYIYFYIAELVSHNYMLWKVVVYLPALLLIYISLIRLNANTFSAYIAFCIFCLPSYGATRAVLAYSILLFGFSFLGKFKLKNWLLGCLIIICSFFTHTSMALPIALSPLCFFKINKKRIWFLVAMFPVAVLAFNYLSSKLFTDVLLLDPDAITGQVGNKFNTYTEDDSIAGAHYLSSFLSAINGYYGLMSIFVMVFYAIKSDVLNSLPKQVSRLVRLSFFVFYVASVIMFSNMNGKIPISMRYFTMVPFFLFSSWPFLLSNSNVMSKKTRYYFILFSAFYLFIKFFVSIYYGASK